MKKWDLRLFANLNILLGMECIYIPKPLEDADSEASPDARTRRNMMRMVISLLEGFDLE